MIKTIQNQSAIRLYFQCTMLMLLLSLVSMDTLRAQNLNFELKGGIITGTPYGKIPEGATGAPGAGIHAGLQSTWLLTPIWGLQVGLAYSQKNAYYDAPISGKVAPTQNIFGVPFQIPVNVPYKGRAEGQYDNLYLDIPFGLVYRPRARFSFMLGAYAAYLVRGSHTGNVDVQVLNLIGVKDEFDETRLLNQWDVGLSGGTEFSILRQFSSFFGLQVGMKNINSQNPEGLEGVYRNIYLTAGLKYRLFES